ncbi:VOC family protein [Helicobacter sp. MIT 21-1697]|nr:VOC family protein [Helicobacter sp. MIT 21-1697]MCX2717450.1 VOC family protein [Helicobacter sp. MIT 21-1697]
MKLRAIVLFVTDMAKMAHFYKEVIGLKTQWDGKESHLEFHSIP